MRANDGAVEKQQSRVEDVELNHVSCITLATFECSLSGLWKSHMPLLNQQRNIPQLTGINQAVFGALLSITNLTHFVTGKYL